MAESVRTVVATTRPVGAAASATVSASARHVEEPNVRDKRRVGRHGQEHHEEVERRVSDRNAAVAHDRSKRRAWDASCAMYVVLRKELREVDAAREQETPSRGHGHLDALTGSTAPYTSQRAVVSEIARQTL